MKTSPAGIDLLCEFEGVETKAYKDSVGVLTIGVGHTSMAGPPKVTSGMTITKAQAREILAGDLLKFESEVYKRLTRTPNQNQFDAMVSLTFNIGPGNFGKSSVLRYFNAGDTYKAADSFRLWNKAGGKVLKGLTNRREKERAWFLSVPVTQPSPVTPDPVVAVVTGHEPEKPATESLWGWLSAWLRG